jgi:hypothetical protein
MINFQRPHPFLKIGKVKRRGRVDTHLFPKIYIRLLWNFDCTNADGRFPKSSRFCQRARPKSTGARNGRGINDAFGLLTSGSLIVGARFASTRNRVLCPNMERRHYPALCSTERVCGSKVIRLSLGMEVAQTLDY